MTPDETASVKADPALDRALALVVVVLGLLTVPSLVAPSLQVRVVAPAADLVLNTLAAGVTLAVAVRSRARFQERREPVVLFQGAAFLTLSLANGLHVLLVVLGLDAGAGMSLVAPAQAPLYVFTTTHILAATVFIAGGLASLRRRPVPRLGISFACALVALAMIGCIEALGGALPALAVPVAPAAADGIFSPTPLGTAGQVLAALLFLWAAAITRRIYRRDGALGDAFLAVGLVFSGFAQLAGVVGPGTYTGLVTSADILRLIFDVLLLVGMQRETVVTLSTLRQATAELSALRASEVEHAALEERSRVARELHDGVAQSLWLAKLKIGRLGNSPSLDAEATSLIAELEGAIDAGLAEAHEAVATLRMSGGPDGTLNELLRRLCNDFADRFGLRVEYEAMSDLPRLAPRMNAECLRVVHEALSNAHRHADATRVRVTAHVGDGRLTVTVQDNGCGFDPEPVWDRAYGLESMRERATILGGELRIESRPQDGTSVHLLVPLAAPALAASGA